MKFTLTIELGNAAMMTGADVAGALTELAGKLADRTEDLQNTNAYDRSGTIRDLNGNRVGIWRAA